MSAGGNKVTESVSSTRMDFDEFTQNLVDWLRDTDEHLSSAEFQAGYDAAVNAALATGWTQQELWDESDRRLSETLALAIKEMESELENG